MRVPTLPRRGLRFAGAVLGLVGVVSAQGQGSGEPWDGRTHRCDYTIEASVHGEVKRLSGREVLRFTNQSTDRIPDLWFHLYWNAFANNRSTHLHEARGKLRGDKTVEDGWGWQRISAISVEGHDLLPTLRYQITPLGREEDRTVFSVDLPRPIDPGETIEVRIDWEAQIPIARRRTGYKGDFLFIAHWFPQLGVYEAGRGWNCHQFHANTEFYSNYGTYDVTLDLPARYEKKVGGSGVIVTPPERRGDRVITRFMAPSPADRSRRDRTGRFPLVHGFTWTADPRYVVYTSTFHYEEWAEQFPSEVAFARKAFGPAKNLELRDVSVTLLMQPEHARSQWRRHFDATSAALFFYGLWFGEYPFEHITVVDPAFGAAAGGMEYPTLFTAGTSMFTSPDMHRPESVTVHEAGHQFWYGLVGNNEFEAAWLDEGFNSFTDSEALIRRYGPSHATTSYARIPIHGISLIPEPGGSVVGNLLCGEGVPIPFTGFEFMPLPESGWVDLWRDRPQLCFAEQQDDPRWHDRTRYLEAPDVDPVRTSGFEYLDRKSYTTNSYPRPAVALRSIPALVGHESFLRGMRRYSESWRYRHPYPEDFYAAFNAGCGEDLSWYFEEVFEGTGTVDWSISVDQFRRDDLRGWIQDGKGDFVEVKDPEQEKHPEGTELASVGEAGVPGEVASSAGESEVEEKPWDIEVVLRREGELCLPVVVELHYADGTSERLRWTREEQQQGRWLRLQRRGPQKLRSAVLDPERLWFLDTDMSNNQWFEKSDAIAPLRWSERVFTRLVHLLHWQSGLGG